MRKSLPVHRGRRRIPDGTVPPADACKAKRNVKITNGLGRKQVEYSFNQRILRYSSCPHIHTRLYVFMCSALVHFNFHSSKKHVCSVARPLFLPSSESRPRSAYLAEPQADCRQLEQDHGSVYPGDQGRILSRRRRSRRGKSSCPKQPTFLSIQQACKQNPEFARGQHIIAEFQPSPCGTPRNLSVWLTYKYKL